MPELARPAGRTWGKVRAVRALDRYEAAIRLERIRQHIRELTTFGFPVSIVNLDERKRAELEYTAATEALR